MCKQQAMTWTVHRLHTPLLILHVECEHVFFVVLCMAADLPQLQIENIGCDDLNPKRSTNKYTRQRIYRDTIFLI